MNGIVITWPQLLYISLVLILFYVAELLLFLRKSAQNKARYSARNLHDIDEHGEKIEALQREVESLKVRLAALLPQSSTALFNPEEVTQAGGENTPYSQAIYLAQQGADAEKVSELCGISRGEADLIVALYRTGTPH